MKKFNILYIGLAIVFFVASLLIMKIPGDSGLNRNDDTSTDEISATMEEKNDTEKDINEIGMETDTNSSTQKESESEIESSEVVSEMKSETETEVETLSEEEIKKQEIEDYLKNTNFSALIDFKAEKPYMIMVNRACNCVTVYGIDFHGEYTVPYKTMTCSTGLYQGNTPLGEYYISDKYNWRMMIDASFAQYAVRFNGGVMFHSVPYHTMNKGDMEWEEYNKLGEPASLGCVRPDACYTDIIVHLSD